MSDRKADLKVRLCGVRLKNPVIAASGTFGFGREYDALYDIGQLGGISVKGLTLAPRCGNPPHRVAETPSGMLNAVGLENPGVDAFISEHLPWLLDKGLAVIANIAGSTVDDYCRMAEKLAPTEVHMLEMNISCPNVKSGGVAFGIEPDMVYAVTRAVKQHAGQPLMVKLSPNVADITQNARAAEAAGADCISLINTLTGIAVDAKRRRLVLANNVGGLSGPAVKPVALRMVWQVCKAVGIPVIGMGGIMTGTDAAEFMLCGAQAVMVGTANFADPMACPRIISELEAYLVAQKVRKAGEIVGALIEN
ncbi:MAG: dihydroorotate dehydrogenase [Clostridia bacterium]|nr:dihydroorotate dehydrogenase [Clostridia bacterium]